MYIFAALLFIILLIVIMLAVFRLKVQFNFNSEGHPNFELIISWLNPLIKGIVTMDGSKPVIKLYLFDKKILTKHVRAKGQNKKNYANKLNLFKVIKPEYFYLETSYGFDDPAVTGMIYGAIDLISVYIGLTDLYNNPDFSTSSTYINISALVELNMLSTLISLLKQKISNSRLNLVNQNLNGR